MQFIIFLAIKLDVVSLADQYPVFIRIDHRAQFTHDGVHLGLIHLVLEHFHPVLHNDRVFFRHIHMARHFEQVFLAQSFTVIRIPILLEKGPHGVQPETVHPQVKPEARRVKHRLSHLWIMPVEVRLLLEEVVIVILASGGIVFPR